MKKKFFKSRRQSNPYLRQPSREDLIKKKKRKKIFLIILFPIILAGLIYFFIYCPLWQIKKIVVTNTQEIEVINKLQIIAQQETQGYDFFIWPHDNILLLDKEKLAAEINAQMVLDELEIDKKLFHTLKISAKEKIPVLLWNENQEYYYLDKKGIIMRAIPFDQIKYDLPLVNRGTTTQVIVGREIIQAQDINFIITALDKIKDNFLDWQIIQSVVKSLQNEEIYFYTNENWYIIFNTQADIDKQLDNLSKLLEQKIEDRNQLEYIDLRLDDRIFYK